ncbi:nickel/cobalt transporter [Rouxiella sp. Mn2063]|uniref:nickel/cobalt transporter n=1 Tax=Rouxiella sp. Mn2063 TaxID=3395262 RepID=UPI003BDD1DA5
MSVENQRSKSRAVKIGRSTRPNPARARHWGWSLWPLVIFILLLAIAAITLWQYWPQIQLLSVVWQRELHQQLAELLQQVQANPMRSGMALMLFSLFYGVIHAVGPGHGKMIITTYLATHPSRLKNSLKLTFASAIVQGFTAIILVTVVLSVLQLTSRQLHQSSFWLEKGSFMVVMLLGLLLCWRAIKHVYRTLQRISWSSTPAIRRIQPLNTPHATHQHDEHCGCGHRHLPDDRQLQGAVDWRAQVAIVFAMGLRPCSGAIMVLLFSKVIGVYFWGVMSALVMALGTSLTVSLIGVVVYYCRAFAMKVNKTKAPAHWVQVSWSLLALCGGIILLAAGVILYRTSVSAFGGGAGPFG